MYHLIIAITLLGTPVKDSTSPFPYYIKSSAHPFKWEDVEVNVPQRYKDSVLTIFAKNCHHCFIEGFDPKPEIEAFKNSFHFVDLNGDGLADLVYEGRSDGEPNIVEFYLNRKKKFDKVFSDYERLLDLIFQNKRLTYLVIDNYGCCAETVNFERHFFVDENFQFRLVIQRAILKGMELGEDHYARPDGWFDQPVKFRILNSQYALRYTPEITNKTPDIKYLDDDTSKGNIIALYPAGNRGIAWGYKKDTTGREWWLVEMEPAVFLPYKMYYDYDDKLTHYYGWMSSRFVERLP